MTLILPAYLTETATLHAGIVLLIASLALYVVRSLSPKAWIHHTGWTLLLFGIVALASSIAIRSQTATYFALSNMYESLMMLSMLMLSAFLVLDRRFNLRYAGWAVVILSLATVAFATTLPMEIKPLQAALQSYWRAIHVPIIIGSYAMFALAFVSSLAYLVTDAFRSPATPLASGGAGTGSFDTAPDSLALYDEVTYRCVALGFPLLAIGIILGGLWANEAWGNYWSWDPKESMSLVTLLAYGAYLHLRVNDNKSPKVLAWVSVAGFAIMLLTYFGVNIMGVGLHSYGKIG